MADKNRSSWPHHILEALFKAHAAEISAYVRQCWGAGPPNPDDIAQNAFERLAAQKRKSIRNPRAFLYATARNAVIDYHRRKTTREKYVEEAKYLHAQEKLDGISPERVLLDKERFQIMREAILSLPEMQRRILLMHRLEGLTYVEIAKITGLSETTIRRHLANAMAYIRDVLRSKGFEAKSSS